MPVLPTELSRRRTGEAKANAGANRTKNTVLGVAISLVIALFGGSVAAANPVFIPNVITGVAEQDRLGQRGSFSLSADGTTIAVGTGQSEYVRVFRWDGNSMSQIGQTLTAAGGGFGRSVSLSDDGLVLAVGQPLSDLAGTNNGTVRVYDFEAGSWTLRGSPVNGVPFVSFGTTTQDGFGSEVALSGDGNRFVAAGFGSSTCQSNGGARGSVKAYSWNGTSWVKTGNTLEGADCSIQLGRHLDISDDGTTIVVSSLKYVEAFGLNSSSVWTVLGNRLAFPSVTLSSGGAASLSLSDDGSTLAFGRNLSPGAIEIYRYSGGGWVRLGDILRGALKSDDFTQVALSGNGNSLVVGAQGIQPRGKVSVLDWNGTAWAKRFADMEGSSGAGYINFGHAVDISEDGRVTAASDREYSTYRGLIRLNAVGPYSLSFDLGGGTGDYGSVDRVFKSALTLSSSAPVREGFAFDGWALSAGGAREFTTGSSYTFPLSDRVLYARWVAEEPAVRTITFNLKGGSSSALAPTSGTQGSIFQVPNDEPARTNFTFEGWSLSDGGELAYEPGDSFSVPASNLVLYARWVEVPAATSVTVGYNLNGGPGSAPTSLAGLTGAELTVSTVVPSREGFVFDGWSTVANGERAFAPGQSIVLGGSNGTLFARWIAVEAPTFADIDFALGGGSGGPPQSLSVALGSRVSLPVEIPARSGFSFSGWALFDGGEALFGPGDTFTVLNEELTLFAVWVAEDAPAASGGGDSMGGNRGVISAVTPPSERSLLAAATRPRAPLPPTEANRGSTEGRATIGGREVLVEVRADVPGRQTFVFGNGGVSVTVPRSGDPSGGNGSVGASVESNRAASFAGSGLRPGSSVVPVLTTGAGGNVALSSVAVRPDGSFEVVIANPVGAGVLPLPIGKHSVVIVGTDPRGNEVLITVPLEVTQPAPAPAADLDQGGIPQLAPGLTKVLRAGQFEDVNVERSGSAVSFGSADWGLNIEGFDPEGADGSFSASRQTEFVIATDGFMPGTRLDVWLFSEPTLLYSVEISDDASEPAAFSIPDEVEVGSHTLQVQGVGSDGFVRAINVGVAITAQEVAEVQDRAPTAGTSLLVIVAAVLLVLAFLAIVAFQRNRARGRISS